MEIQYGHSTQIEANRRNATKSTGPKNPEGKVKVAIVLSLRMGARTPLALNAALDCVRLFCMVRLMDQLSIQAMNPP